jgi:hypothetical protein
LGPPAGCLRKAPDWDPKMTSADHLKFLLDGEITVLELQLGNRYYNHDPLCG